MSVQAPQWGVLLAPHTAMAVKAQDQPSGWLSETEKKRMLGLRPARQSVFMACRYALRLLLAGPDNPISTWSLGSVVERAPWVDRCGSPVLGENVEGGGEAEPLPQLSLSHSGSWLACAKAPLPVGVDIEVQSAKRQRDIASLAALVCAPAEQDWLLSQSGEVQQQCFLQLWCLKEAYFKSTGTGVDWQRIRQLEWRRIQPKRVAVVDEANASPAAYARLWKARTAAEGNLFLALCALQSLPTLVPWQVAGDCQLDWLDISEWRLYPA